MPDNKIDILIQVREDIAALQRVQEGLAAARQQAEGAGESLEKTGEAMLNLQGAGDSLSGGLAGGVAGALGSVGAQAGNAGRGFAQAVASGKNLQRASSALSNVLSGNVVGALWAVRGATTAMLGPLGLAMVAVTALVAKLQALHREQKAAEAAQAANDYQWALNRATDSARDLAKESTDAFAAALKSAREFYEETDRLLKRQFEGMLRIAKARLDLERMKTRNNPALNEQGKIIAEQKLLNDFETSSLQLKIKLLSDQKELAEKARANADKVLETAKLELEAAKAKTSKNDWGTQEETARLQAAKKDIQAKIDAAGTAIANANLSGYATLEIARKLNEAAAEARSQLPMLRAKLAGTEGDLKRETTGEAAEKRRADAIATAAENQKAATAEAEKYAAQLAVINERLEDARTTETETAAIKRQTLAEDTRAKLTAESEAVENERSARAARAAAMREQNALAEIALLKDIAASDQSLTRAERQQKINDLTKKEIELIKELIDARWTAAQNSGDADEIERLEAEILRLKKRLAQLSGEGAGAYEGRRRAYEDSHQPGQVLMDTEGFAAGLMQAGDQLGSAGENIASLFSGTLLDSVNAISEGIYGWITGTESFGDALRNLGDQVFKELLNTIIRIGVQWLINTILVKTGIISIGATQDLQRTQQTTKTVSSNAQIAASAAPGAAASGISSFGAALVFGALALALILAASSAFEAGGPVRGGEQLIRVNERGEEFVMTAAARRKYGDAMLADINAGRFDAAAYAALATAPSAATATPSAALAQARGGAPASAGQGLAGAIAAAMPRQQQDNRTTYVCFGEDEVRTRIINSGDFNAEILRVVREERRMNS